MEYFVRWKKKVWLFGKRKFNRKRRTEGMPEDMRKAEEKIE